MHIPDLINGMFEASGAVATFTNVKVILRDKAVRGFHFGAVAFFTSWSLWNLYYYPHLGQWFSFTGGAVLGILNLTYTGLAIYYSRRLNVR